MRRPLLLALLAAAGLLAWRQTSAAFNVPAPDPFGALDDAAYGLTGYRLMGSRWLTDAAKPENISYVSAAHSAELAYGLPADLLVRLLWQESRFNPRAHNARSNASGIAQIVPRWHPGVDPWNPFAAIPYAANYLAQLRRQFGSWELALKAYNWGPGNLSKLLLGAEDAAPEPLETQLYSQQILADLAEAGRAVA